ncbi:MAG: hypothetical protein NVSMB17_19540 [Candidatus Dormibacteria bacterium]
MNTAAPIADTPPPVIPVRPRPEMAGEHLGLNARLGVMVTRAVGNMWSVYITVVFVFGWIGLATFGPLHQADPYPFPFLLFMGNLVQLLLVFVILVGQGVLGRSADLRSEKTFKDAEAILREVTVLHSHLLAQDKLLNRGIELVEDAPHPWLKARHAVKPARVEAQFIGLNGRIAAGITRAVSTMWAFYVATIFQFGWILLAQVGIIRFDPYPFAFLLFISSLLQLVFMFVIMVGQDVLGRANDQRAEQTFLDGEAVLHECRRLQRHLTEQDRVIVAITEYIKDNAPSGHPLLRPVAPAPLPPDAS